MTTKQSKAAAPKAAAPKADVPKAKRVVVAIDPASINSFARGMASAFASDEASRKKLEGSLMERVAKAVAFIGKPISSAQYDAKVGPALTKAFNAKVEAGAITEGTASKTRSQVKTATLAILASAATPEPGEGFKTFVARAAERLATAKLPDGSPVWVAKVGRPAKQGKAEAKATAKASGAPTASPAAPSGSAGSAAKSPQEAAALILTKNNAKRAAILVTPAAPSWRWGGCGPRGALTRA